QHMLSGAMPAPLPPPTLFPYTTLFRSVPPGTGPPGEPRESLAGELLKSRVSGFRDSSCRRQRHPARIAEVRREHARDLCGGVHRSEEHTSELQSRGHLVCRLLLEKKKD